jgi:hypothetical protein
MGTEGERSGKCGIPLPVRRFHAKFSGRKFGEEDQQLPDLGIIFCMKTARWIGVPTTGGPVAAPRFTYKMTLE